MKKEIKRLKRYRSYSEEFKRTLVGEYESGQQSVLELGRLYGIHISVIYKWIHQFSSYSSKGYILVEKSKSSQSRLKALETQLQQLEQAVGQKQLRIEYLEKLIDLAEQEYGLDLKKNSSTRFFSGSDPSLNK